MACGEFWGVLEQYPLIFGVTVLLTGLYRRSLDDKQRIALPKPLRGKGLEDIPWYVTPGLDGCLAVYPEPAFAALADRLASGSPNAPEIRDYSRLFYSQAACVELDRQCRFRIPQQLVDWAALSGEIAIVGVRDHLEIWSAEQWEEYVAQRDQQYDELAVTAFQPIGGSQPVVGQQAKQPTEIPAPAARSPK